MKIKGTELLWCLVYMREKRELSWTKLKEETEKKPGRRVFLGDFNCNIRKYGERKTQEDKEVLRKSMDEVCNEEGKGMIKWMDETVMHVLNANIKGDEEGRFTHAGPQGNTVIYYIVVNEESREDIKGMKIGKRIDSDHLPLEVSLYREGTSRKEEEEEEYEDWSKKGRGGIQKESVGGGISSKVGKE